MKKIKKILKKQGFTSKVLSFRFYVLGGKKKIDSNAFTLVELIIVIAIIAVLAVAAFMMLTKWLGKSRDSRKLADIETVSKSLMVWLNDLDNTQGIVPTPDNESDVMFDGVNTWTQGVFGTTASDTLDSIQKAPTNPTNDGFYTYSVTTNQKKYQLVAELEDGSVTTSFLNQASATDRVNTVIGNFDPGIYVFLTGSTYKALYLPSIVVAADTNGSDLDITTSQPFVLDGSNKNLVDSKGSSVMTYDEALDSVTKPLFIIWSGTDLGELSDPAKVQLIADNLGGMISGNPTLDLDQINSLFSAGGSELSNFQNGGSVPVIPSCATQPSYTHAIFVIGNPNDSDTVWQNTNSSEACYYSCTDGYGGNECEIAPSCAAQPSYYNATFIEGTPIASNMTWQTTDDSAPCYFSCADGYAFDGSDCSQTFTIISSCKTLYDDGERGDGTYTIDVAGGGVMDVYCDMTTDGGGWTLVAVGKSSNTSTILPNGLAHGTVTSPSQTTAGNLALANWNHLGTVTRWKKGSTKFFTKYGSNAINPNSFKSYGNEPIPSCSKNLSSWVVGRGYHIADCRTLGSNPLYIGYFWDGHGNGGASSMLMNSTGGTARVR